ncbi:PIN domain-containing protein [Kinneretia aquatilis]|uniref:PIN domain-containing protein n=1 Tax=Kinneretia aquatilis TaxID=2070761 RepID=UPI0014950B5E|nr:PIN domain-containing protein [Paucibacter aquatile]WIV97928.1 PIN domain-containing protein [Paucibacter aquatile]
MKAVQARRVVLDLPLLLQALLCSDDAAQALRQAWQSGACVPLVNAEMAQALITALRFPRLALSEVQQQELLADFLPYAEVVGPSADRRRSREASHALELALSPHAKAELWLCSDPALRLRGQRLISRRQLPALKGLSGEEFLAGLSSAGHDVTG